MMSASAMSALIRAKKKKMMEDSGAMTESGIPMDAQDIYNEKNKEPGEVLSENIPAPHSDGQDLSPEAEMSEEKKAQISAKREKIRMMMLKMDI